MTLRPKIDLDNNDRKRNIWFTSDIHYNHENMIKIKNRPFENIDEMNSYIISQFKSYVKQGDIVFDLGDMIWKESPELIKEFRKVIPEKSYKIFGNHDNQESYMSGAYGNRWKTKSDILDVIIKYKGEDIQVNMCHYPLLDWNHRFRGSWGLHGHVHGNLDNLNKESGELRLDVGFDTELAKEIGTFLIPFDEIYKRMKLITNGETFRNWAREKDGSGKIL